MNKITSQFLIASIIGGAMMLVFSTDACCRIIEQRNLNNTDDIPGTRHYQIVPEGRFASIDVELMNRSIDTFRRGNNSEKAALIENIRAHSDRYAPPVFFFMAEELYRNGRKEEAVFWRHAGHIRGTFDKERCQDKTAHSYLSMLLGLTGRDIVQYCISDIPLLERVVPKAIAWDKKTPYNYDHRWINLHGLGSINASLGNGDNNKPMSLSEKNWPELAEKVRQQFSKDFNEYIKMAKAQTREP